MEYLFRVNLSVFRFVRYRISFGKQVNRLSSIIRLSNEVKKDNYI